MRKNLNQSLAKLSPQDAFTLYQSMDVAIQEEIRRHGISGKVVLYRKYKDLLAEYIHTLYQAERQKQRAGSNPGTPAPIHTSIPEFHLCYDMDQPCSTVGFYFTDLYSGSRTTQRFYISNQ